MHYVKMPTRGQHQCPCKTAGQNAAPKGRIETSLWLLCGRHSAFDTVRLCHLGRIGEVHETLHFAILDRPNVHQRKVKALTCKLLRRSFRP